MARYNYKALNESGETLSGAIDADSPEMASNVLAARGLIPTEVKAARAAAEGGGVKLIVDFFSPIRAPELILFTKQFRTMLRSGVPIVKLLQVMESQTENKRLRIIIANMSEDIREGASLHEVFRKHPKAFSSLYCSMVQAGEASGALPEVLERLTYILEHENKIKSDIRSAMQYPMIVLSFLFVAFFVLLTFVIPKFVNIFVSAGLELPLPTRICMVLYQFFNHYWYLCIVGLALFIGGMTLFLRSEQGKYFRDTLLIRVPVVGPLFVKAAMSRFASIFAILQSSGVEVRESMRILAGTIGNHAIAREFERINILLEEGHGISGPLRNAKYFTPIVVNMVAIGEESGNLDEMLGEISEHYDFELDYAMKKLSEAIGPILVVGLAAVVGFFALAIFLPMWDLTKMVK